eukprot:NODE_739_length_4331_cov_0.796078.p2 type:complete len:106 gc:universal NODE_739_length_4331_cov_0.796078:1862-2179(+)
MYEIDNGNSSIKLTVSSFRESQSATWLSNPAIFLNVGPYSDILFARRCIIKPFIDFKWVTFMLSVYTIIVCPYKSECKCSSKAAMAIVSFSTIGRFNAAFDSFFE